MVCEKHPQISLALSKNKLPAACEQAFELSVSARWTCTYKQVSTSPLSATPPHIDPERIINPGDDSPEVEPASIHSEKLWAEHLRTDLCWFLIQFSGWMLACEYSPPPTFHRCPPSPLRSDFTADVSRSLMLQTSQTAAVFHWKAKQEPYSLFVEDFKPEN